jgi:hypothetical protein
LIYAIGEYKNVMITDGEPLNHYKILDIIKNILDFSENLIIDTN